MAWRNFAVAAVCGLTLSACGPKASEQTAETSIAPPGVCHADTMAPWTAGPSTTLSVSGSYDGDCVGGDATLTIATLEGAPVYTFSLPVSVAANTVFADAKDQQTMAMALSQWVDPASNTTMQTTGALPAWAANQEEPGNAEFPFMPEVSREEYAALRAKNVPLYCHVQGGESMACLVYDAAGKKVTKVGLQRFPG